MFCDQCGTELPAGSNHCQNCGKALGWPTSRLAQSRLESHLHILGILWIVIGALWLIPAVILIVLGGVVHLAIPVGDEIARHLGPAVLLLIGWFCLMVGGAGICVGWGLMQHQTWARITAIILGVIALLHPPLGTALGVYTLWVLLADEGGLEYRRMAHV